MPSRKSLVLRVLGFAACSAILGSPTHPALAQTQGQLFPEPFVIEHHLVQIDDQGRRFATPPVTDYYGGTWIVSERADGSRLVVDLARREVTEIHPERGTYSTIGFERLAQVMARVEELEGTRPEQPADGLTKGNVQRRRSAADWSVRETTAKARHTTDVQGPTADLLNGEGSRYLEIRPADDPLLAGAKSNGGPTAEDPTAEDPPAARVWTVPTVQLGSAARDALAGFERDALGTEGLMAAVREHVDGAVPVRTVRPVKSATGGQIEDLVTRIEPLERFDRKLIAVPEGLRRVPHTLEGLMSFLERESQRQRAMTEGDELDSFTDMSAGGEND